MFVSFGAPKNEAEVAVARKKAKAWLDGVRKRVTSAFALRADAAKGNTFYSLMLSAEGYRFLGESRPGEGAFRDGMKNRRPQLADPRSASWEAGYKETSHALVIVADVDLAALTAATNALSAEVTAAGGRVLVAEYGSQQFNAAGEAVEHFGYADGISQPTFFDAGHAVPGPLFDQRTPLKRVLVEDRHAPGHHGSYFVFRKLEQNVQAFDAAVKAVAARVGITAELAGAMAVGRFKDGTPTALSGAPVGNPDADFNYDADPTGGKTPHHAHIRKTNPRESLGFFTDLFAQEKTRRIARRGITYGTRKADLSDQPSTGVGLLFMCYQSDIRDQFEFMQETWANNSGFPPFHGVVGLDPVIGQTDGPATDGDSPRWPKSHGAGEKERVMASMHGHVVLKGGEYFFAPSIAGLKALSQ